jgi:predicted Zn-dependent peptidase
VPVPESFQLSSGLQVWLLRTKEVPLVTLSLIVRSGSAADPPGKEGLCALTATMLDEGAGQRGALELAEEIDFLGAELAIEAEKELSQVTIEVLQRNLDPALDILADLMMRPRFEEKEWERVKALWLNDLAQRREDPREVARVVAERVFYGDANPFGHPFDGYEAAVKSIGLSDIKDFYRSHVRPDNAILLVVGNAEVDDLRAGLEKRFSAWRGDGPPPFRPKSMPPSTEPRLVIVDKPGAPQTVVRILLPAPEFSSPRAPPLSLANIIFGGTFTSRLMTNLREKNKFTYGASSALTPRSVIGHLTAGSSVYSEKTGEALVELCREFHAMERGKLTQDEVQKARSTQLSHLFEALETQGGTLRVYTMSGALGFSPGERREFYRRSQALTGDDISLQAQKTLQWERSSIVLVGDRKTIEGQLGELMAHLPGKLAPGDLEGKPFSLPKLEIRGRDGEKTE